MRRLGAVFSGCLTGMVLLVLGTIIVSAIENYLYSAPFLYEELKRVASPDSRIYAHLFTKNTKQDCRGPYSGVCITRGKKLSRSYEDEVFSISPIEALDTLEFHWISNDTLEISFRVNTALTSHLHYGKPPSNMLNRIIFTELQADGEDNS